MTALDLLMFAQGQFGQPGAFPGARPGGMPPGAGVPPGGGAAGAGAAIGIFVCYMVFMLLIVTFAVIVQWKIFAKAGEPGWACLVPVYNCMVLSKICGRGEMFGLLLLVPCVGLVIGIMLTLDLAKAFDKDAGFGVGLLLLPVVFYPILAFGNAQYVGVSGSGGNRSRRRRDYDDEDEEDDRPRRRRRPADDDDDDDRPRRKRRDDY